MDFGNALLLAAVIFLVVELTGRLFPDATAREKVFIAIVAGQVVAELVAHSVWGNKQIVEGIPLSTMGWVSLVIVGLALAGLATLGKQAVQAVSNIGQPGPTP